MIKSITHLIKGRQAEDQAAKFLKKNGLKIIATNISYKVGEIDIIASDKESFVFVEVKYRKNSDYGSPAEMVSVSKQKRVQKAALMWMQEKSSNEQYACRFDVIGITQNSNQNSENNSKNEIQWIQNAF